MLFAIGTPNGPVRLFVSAASYERASRQLEPGEVALEAADRSATRITAEGTDLAVDGGILTPAPALRLAAPNGENDG
jgi:hypothetical protein